MLEELVLENFRGFDQHSIPFRKLTIVVGANNAGKSTVVEALRLVALVVRRFRRGTGGFVEIPEWLHHPDAFRGIQPGIAGRRGFEGHGPTTFHQYGDPPAILRARFSSGDSVEVFVGPEGEIHGVARGADGHAVGAVGAAATLGLSEIQIQPQVAPLLRRETELTEETIRRGEGTYLAPQHFRNQLLLADEADWAVFAELAEETWPGFQIIELRAPNDPRDRLELDVRDGPFVGEISLMGHGLQMWLQTIWFLSRTEPGSCVVLDEPDVYMHPDLQRRLLDLVRSRFEQLVIATHSIELITDVEPSSILAIDRGLQRSQFLTDLPGVQTLIDGLGGVHNIQVARLLRGRSFLFVEGDDLRILRNLQAQLRPDASPLDLIPNGELGGRGGWLSRLPSRLPERNVLDQPIFVYCLLDRDYFPDEEVAERLEEANRWRVNLHIWAKKELENYLLVPTLVARVIATRVGDGRPSPTPDEVALEIDRVVEALRESPITDGVATELFQRNRRGGLTAANREARARVAARWGSRDDRWGIAPGKAVLSALSEWAQQQYAVSFGAGHLARNMLAAEADQELFTVIDALATGRRLQ